MEFPAEATVLLDKDDDDYHLDENNTKVMVDTDKFYE